MPRHSEKTPIIEGLFIQRWNQATGTLSNRVIYESDVTTAVQAYRMSHPTTRLRSPNPYNFFKDIFRSGRAGNRHWPTTVLKCGYTAAQRTGNRRVFEFIPLPPGQTTAFLEPTPWVGITPHLVQSASLPIASRNVGRPDEMWLIQVLVRLNIVETHFARRYAAQPSSPSAPTWRIEQVDHLQMGVKQAGAEIDALFLVVETMPGSAPQQVIVCCEAKGVRDDILEDQLLAQVNAALAIRQLRHVNVVIPLAVKAFAPSQVYIADYQPLNRAAASAVTSLTVGFQGVYELVPPVPGIGQSP